MAETDSDPVLKAQESAYRAGLTPEQFWRLTPHETRIFITAWNQSDQDRFKEGMALAWHVAAFTRAKRLKPLRTILKKMDDATRPTTPESLLAFFKDLAASNPNVKMTIGGKRDGN